MSTVPAELQILIATGHDLEDSGNLSAAAEIYTRAMRMFPASPLPYLNLGNIYSTLNDSNQARQLYEMALQHGPCVPALVNVGNIEYLRENHPAAIEWYAQALAQKPDHLQAMLGFANACIAANQTERAESQLLTWFQHGGEHLECRKLLVDIARRRDADQAWQHLRQIRDWDADCWLLAAELHRAQLEPDQAFAAAVRALQLRPYDDRARTFAYFTSMLTDSITPADLQNLHALAFPATPDLPTAGPNPRAASTQPLRIGYVSGDYYAHAGANYLYPMIANHSDQFVAIMLSNSSRHDEVTARFKALKSQFIDISGMTTSAAKELIRKLDLDILCDCSGQTAGNRLDLFDERLAPLQVTFLGAYLTSGAPAIDFRIVSHLTDPPEFAAKWHRERLAWMDRMQTVYQEWIPKSPPASNPYLQNQYLTIGFVNNQEKLNRETLDDLARILSASDARLKFVGISSPSIQNIIQRQLAHCSAQVEILPRVSIGEYLQQISTLDIVYDSYPYSGSTTTMDCLLSGVPVLSRFGERAHSRSSYILLHQIGLQQFLFAERQARIDSCIALCRDPRPLLDLRQTLPEILRNSEIMNAAHYSWRWESFLRELSANPQIIHLPD
ncbi:MAG: tetratricopeptide repeat protein [Xanthomonadales bacterium]|jgi:predicted O-linked N-acetylglucosamine transferase (SPINDLY family)|nr:tetratricopeptide repeat protein [Xanthomonadales bacterium]